MAYIRISQLDQSHHSLEAQERMIREYCDRNKLILKGVFTDNGQSSYTFDRPDYKALEAFLKKNKDVQFLIFTDHSRFSRHTAEALMKLKELEDKMRIKVYATTDVFGTDFSDPSAFIMRTLQYVMGESELHNIRKRTRAGLLQGKLSGRFMSSAPYGYKNARDDQDKPVLIVQEGPAKIVRFIFREFLNGLTVTEIAREARKMGFNPKGKSAIPRVLSNCVYCGLISIPAHKDRKSQYVKGLHTPIIPENEFWIAQEKLVVKPTGAYTNDKVPLRGALVCHCGRKLSAGNSRGKGGKYYWYYLCPVHRENFPATRLHAQFAELMECLSLAPERIEWLRAKMEEEIRVKTAGQQSEIEDLSRELTAVRLRILTAERKYLTGNVREETFAAVMVDLRASESRTLISLQQAQTNGPVFYARLCLLLPRLANIGQAFAGMPLTKQHQFIRLTFGDSLSYRAGIFRTQFLHPAFSHNALILKEKRLLLVEKPVPVMGDQPHLGPRWEPYRNIDGLAELLELIG